MPRVYPFEPSIVRPNHNEQRNIGRYRVLDGLGAGGMGVVYRAYDCELHREVALKLLRFDPEHGQAHRGEARLLREAQSMARLSHPNVVPIYGVERIEDQLCIVMEYVEGDTLAAWLRAERRWPEIVACFVQAGRGLAAAHAAGILHRDFKPGNVLVGRTGRIKVVDFGLAKGELGRIEPSTASSSSGHELSSPLTELGVVMGTPRYMAPEQQGGRKVDARSDQFAFCVALFEALYRQRPYPGPSEEALRRKCDGTIVEPEMGSTVPAWLRAILVRGLAPRASARWPSMAALLTELERRPRSLRRRRYSAAVATAVVGLGMGAIELVDDQRASLGGCHAETARLARVWDEAHQEAVRSALGDSETWSRVRAALDAVTNRWLASRHEACEATHVREQTQAMLDLRMACLGRWQRDAKALINVLSRADVDVRRRAVEAATTLPDPAQCADPTFLAADIAPPDDPSKAAAIDDVRDTIAHAGAFQQAAKYEEARGLARAALESARVLDYGPVIAESLVRLGVAQRGLGDYAGAKRNLSEGYFVAAEHGHHALAAKAATAQVYLFAVALADLEAALVWARHARAEVDRTGGDPIADAHLTSNVGTVWGIKEEYALAADNFHRSLVLRERARGPRHPLVATSVTNLGITMFRSGRFEEALAHHRRALFIWERAVGETHLEVGSALANVGASLAGLGQYDAALHHQERGLLIRERALGPDHPLVATSLHYIAILHSNRGEHEAALRCVDRALRIRERAYGFDHPRVEKSATLRAELSRAVSTAR